MGAPTVQELFLCDYHRRLSTGSQFAFQMQHSLLRQFALPHIVQSLSFASDNLVVSVVSKEGNDPFLGMLPLLAVLPWLW